MAHLLVGLGLGLVGLVFARGAQACVPSAERVVGWDLGKDLVAVAVWAERGEPPQNGAAGGFELRRISTGEVLRKHDCGQQRARACRYRDAFAVDGVAWQTRGQPGLARRLRFAETRTKEGLEVALEARTRAGWRRLLWVQVMGEGEAAQERQRYRWGALDRGGGATLISFEMRASGGNCPYTVARALLVPEADLADPARAERQAALLASPRRDHPFEHWRTVAELGPLPAGRLLEAMEAAEADAQVDFAVRWWRANTGGLPAAQVAHLAALMKKSPGLPSTRARLGL